MSIGIGSLTGKGTADAVKDVLAGRTAGTKDPRLLQLKKACEQFEAVFAKQLLGEMRKGVKGMDIGDKAGSAIYQDMMDQAIGDSIAHQGALGIGKMLYHEFEKQVTASSNQAATTAAIRQENP